MGKYLDWYLVELESFLEGRLRRDAAHDLVCQAEAHLAESAEDFRARGMDAKASEIAAIQRFGSARKIAEAAIGHSGAGHWIAKLVMLAAFAGFATLASMSMLGVGPQDWFVQTMLWGCGVVFFVAAMFVRRLPWKELAGLGACSWIGLSLGMGTVQVAGSELYRSQCPPLISEVSGISEDVSKHIARLIAERRDFDVHPGWARVQYLTDRTRNVIEDYDSLYLPGSKAKLEPLGEWGFIYPANERYEIPLGLIRETTNTGFTYISNVKYGRTGSLDQAKAAWSKTGALAARLRTEQQLIEADRDRFVALSKTSVWQSAASHSSRGSVIAAIWLIGALLLALAGSHLPKLTNERSRVHRQLA